MFRYVWHPDELVLEQHPEYLDRDSIEIDPPIGPHILMDKETLRSVGGYDDNVFLYHEEYILYQKYKKLGLTNYALPACRVVHVGSVSTQKAPSKFVQQASLDSTYYYYKNYFRLNRFQRIALEVCYFLGKLKLRKIRN